MAAFYSRLDGLIDRSNAWNAAEGFQCMLINDSRPSMDATWRWDDGSNVHSFPHVRFNSDKLPVRMSAVRSLRARVNWTMGVESNTSAMVVVEDAYMAQFDASNWATNKVNLDKQGVVANVAWDFFADPSKENTYNPVMASTEIMIWLGRVGNARPLRGASAIATMQLDGVQL
jgi:hypothetical protein